jgi:hypothetical protein
MTDISQTLRWAIVCFSYSIALPHGPGKVVNRLHCVPPTELAASLTSSWWPACCSFINRSTAEVGLFWYPTVDNGCAKRRTNRNNVASVCTVDVGGTLPRELLAHCLRHVTVYVLRFSNREQRWTSDLRRHGSPPDAFFLVWIMLGVFVRAIRTQCMPSLYSKVGGNDRSATQRTLLVRGGGADVVVSRSESTALRPADFSVLTIITE